MWLRRFGKLALLCEKTVFHAAQCTPAQKLSLTRSFTDDFIPFPGSKAYQEQKVSPLSSKPHHPDEVLCKLSDKKNNIYGYDMVHAFSVINAFYRNKQTHQKERDNHFLKLISILNQHIEKLTGREALRIIGILNYNDVRQDLSISTTLLNHIICHIDDLLVSDYKQLSYSIKDKRLTSVHLREQLNNALWKKIESDLSTTIDPDIEFLRSAFLLTTRLSNQHMHQEIIRTLQEKLCLYPQKIAVQDAVSIFMSLKDLEYFSASSIQLLHRIQNEIIQQFHSLNELQIKQVVSTIATSIKLKRRDTFYNEELFGALVRRTIDDNMGCEFSVTVAVGLERARYKSEELINYCCATFIKKSKNRAWLENDKLFQSLMIIQPNSNFKSVFWDEFQDYLNQSRKLSCLSLEELIPLIAKLLVLNVYPPSHVLERIFDGSLEWSQVPTLTGFFCMIYQKLKSDPSYDGPMPTQSQLVELEVVVRSKRVPSSSSKILSAHLEEAISDPLCVRSDINTRLFHVIDHVVAFHEDGTPAPITTDSYTGDLFEEEFEYLEDLRVPPGCRMILIVVALRRWYFTNTMELLGGRSMYLDTLKNTYKHPVVVINEWTWDDIPSDKRTPFLINEIRSKLDNSVLDGKSTDRSHQTNLASSVSSKE